MKFEGGRTKEERRRRKEEEEGCEYHHGKIVVIPWEGVDTAGTKIHYYGGNTPGI